MRWLKLWEDFSAIHLEDKIDPKIDLLDENITSKEVEGESNFWNRALKYLGRFIQGEELQQFLSKIRTVASFDDFTLKFSRSPEAINAFIIHIIDSKDSQKVGKFVAFIYKDNQTQKMSLQIQKVEIYPKYRGRGIMRRFYRSFNQWLKDNFDNFGMFTSDFTFLYNDATRGYDGWVMWEDLVKKGLAQRLGPKEAYVPPKEPPKNKMWVLDYGYKLI